MKVSLLTDAPKHNLALMKLSAWHKKQGDEVILNMPIITSDYTYASILFEKNRSQFIADEYGGPAFVNLMGCRHGINNTELPTHIEKKIPDYSLYDLDFSLGYTYRPCFRICEFCKVPSMTYPNIHHSIWEFHRVPFNKICLLNNNTFFDPEWKETFEEIWDANLTVIDENGYDLRLIDDEKADALKHTKFEGKIHFAWDRIEDERKILRGLEILDEHKIRDTHIYVLIGYNTTFEEDIHRCQKLIDYGHDPYIMPYNQSKEEKRFKRFIDSFMWRKYKTIEKAWQDYNG